MTTIFHLLIEGLSVESILQEIDRRQNDLHPFWIVTANPEILLEARRNRSYRETLSHADTRSVDGFGLWLLLRMFGHKTHRVTGIDLADYLIKMANDRMWRVGLIGGGGEAVAKQAAAKLAQKYPGLQCMTEHGGLVNQTGEEDEEGREARERLKKFQPHILLVAFGHPKQEYWIEKYCADFHGLKAVMGVGGTFDVWAGVIKRAPSFLRHIGLEWLWRLFMQPQRLSRILNAVIVFSVLALWERLRNVRHSD